MDNTLRCRTGHSCRTHWYHLPCIFRSFKRSCKGTKTITSLDDIDNFDRLAPRDQADINACIRRGPDQFAAQRAAARDLGASTEHDDTPALPPEKRARLETETDERTEYEVETILGLATMISRGGDQSNSNVSTASSTTTPANSSDLVPFPMELTLESHQQHETLRARHTVRRDTLPVAEANDFTEPTKNADSTVSSQWRLPATEQASSDATTRACSPRQWQPVGTECAVLHHDRWHPARIHSYSETYAMVEKLSSRDIIPIHLCDERFRISWDCSKNLSSRFASS